MDVQRFRDSRETDLKAFKDEYAFLKTSYASALASAIRETDPQKQQELIQQVLQANADMSDRVREMLGTLTKGQQGFNPADVNALTKELIQYQQEYAEIEQSREKVNTLKRIHTTNTQIVQSETVLYNLYIVVFVVLVFAVAYLVFRTEALRAITQTVQQLPTLPVR